MTPAGVQVQRQTLTGPGCVCCSNSCDGLPVGKSHRLSGHVISQTCPVDVQVGSAGGSTFTAEPQQLLDFQLTSTQCFLHTYT